MKTQRYILHADFDTFYIAVERAMNPRLRGRPVVIGNRADRRGIVAAVSPEARQYGVYPSMTISRATLLCPSLTVVDGNADLYSRSSEAVGEIMQRFTPWFEAASVDEAFLDLTGTQKLFGGAVDVGARLRREVKDRFSLDLTIGVAANKLVSRIASRTVKPTGLCDVTPGSECAFLAPLPVRRLPGIGPLTDKRLADFNIITVGELQDTARPFLTSAFGKRGEILYAHARGIDDTPVRPASRPTAIYHEETFVNDTNDRILIENVLFSAVEAAGLSLRAQGLTAKYISVNIQYVDSRRADAGARLAETTDLDLEIYSGAEQTLQRALTNRMAVRRIGVRLSRLSPAIPQLSLIDTGRQYDRQRALTSAVDRIRHTHGINAIAYGRVLHARANAAA